MLPPVDRELCAGVARAAAAIGTAAFTPQLLDLLAARLPFDRKMVMRYSRLDRPTLTLPYRVPRRCIDIYFERFSHADPFLAVWREEPALQVATLQGIDRSRLADRSYLVGFVGRAGLTDELAVFLPAADGEVTALFLERTTGHYSERERRQASLLYPALLALNECHRRAGTDAAPAGPPRGAGQGFVESLVSLHRLSRRESQVLELILAGMAGRAIADALGIGEGTAKNHRKGLYRKLKVGSEREILALALQYAEGLPS